MLVVFSAEADTWEQPVFLGCRRVLELQFPSQGCPLEAPTLLRWEQVESEGISCVPAAPPAAISQHQRGDNRETPEGKMGWDGESHKQGVNRETLG